MNLLMRCARATITSSLSLTSRHYTFSLRPLIRFPPYSTNLIGALNPQDRSTFSSWFQEANKLAKEHLVDSPRPPEIPYQTKVANLVYLIGHIKLPVKFQSFPNGKHYAATLISQENNGPGNGCWIPVLFEGDLAHVVSCNVKENDCVYVTGKLSRDALPFSVHENQGDVHILAADINFVEGFDPKAYDYKRKWNAKLADNVDSGNVLFGGNEKKSGVSGVTGDSSEEIGTNVKHSQITGIKSSSQNPKEVGLWKDVMQNPSQFVNYTGDKSKGLVSPKHPDFRHRESRKSLWLDSAPHWFLESFKNWEDMANSAKTEEVGKDSKEELWRSLAEKPEQWWDNRLDKRNKKCPDFKHKKSGEGLWLNISPKWCVPKDITIVKDRKVEPWVEDPNQWWDNMLDKTNENSTDVKQTETGDGLWLDSSPDCVGKDSKEDLWRSLSENPEQWWDNRPEKKTVNSPDFKHKKSGKGLWIDKAPDWFVSKDVVTIVKDKKNESWKSLDENPEQWWENRLDKRNKKRPDFKHKKSGEGLWLNRSPKWFVPKDITIVKDRKVEPWVEDPNQWWDNMLDKTNENSTDVKQTETGDGLWLDSSPDCVGKDSKEDLWRSLSENPEQWWDNRPEKKTENSPDFKHKKSGKGLWIDKAPDWFVSKDVVTIVKDKKNESWKSLDENPEQWWDNRLDKRNKKRPDFKHKKSGEGLWLNRSPKWFVPKDITIVKDRKVEPWVEDPNQWWDNMLDKTNENSTDVKQTETGDGLWLDSSPDCVGKDSKEDLWRSLSENPEQWWDNRPEKKTENSPDFKHKKSGKRLWIDKAPDWFVSKDVVTIVKDKKNESWKSLVENPNHWWDKRLNKKNVNAPDFEHKETGEGLWLDSSPDWAVSKLPPLKQNEHLGFLRLTLCIAW